MTIVGSGKFAAVTNILRSISDEELHSFVDGELDPARKKSVIVRLAGSPADAARAEIWRQQNEALQAAFAEMLTEPPPHFLRPHCMGLRADVAPQTVGISVSEGSNGTFRRERVMAASLGLAFAAGVATAVTLGLLSEHLDWKKHISFDRETRGSIARRTDEPFVDRTLRAVVPFESVPTEPGAGTAKAIDLLVVPNLSDAGLRLAGMRGAQGPSSSKLCLLYLTVADVELTLCVDALGDRGRNLREVGDLPGPAISWRQKGARYSLSGSLADGELGLLAERARMEIDKFALR